MKELFTSFFTGIPKLVYGLVGFVVLDYITGVFVAIHERKLSSKIGAKGIAGKIMVFILVFLSAMIDHFIIGNGNTVCSMTILFYCANEAISIIENAKRMGLPLPQKLIDVLEKVHR